jgi:hypothetical protein
VAAPQIGRRKRGHKQLFRLPVVRCTRSEKKPQYMSISKKLNVHFKS